MALLSAGIVLVLGTTRPERHSLSPSALSHLTADNADHRDASAGFVVDFDRWNATLTADTAATRLRLDLRDDASCPGNASVCGMLPGCVDLCADRGSPAAVPAGTPAESIGSALVYLPEATDIVPGAASLALAKEKAARFTTHVAEAQFGARAAACDPATARAWGFPEAGVGVLLDHTEHYIERSLASGGFLAPAQDDVSPWTTKVSACSGEKRGLQCYFNLSACSKAPVDEEGTILRLDLNPQVEARKKSIRRGAAIPGWVGEGAFWSAAQITAFVFDRMQPSLRRAVDAIAVDGKSGRPIKELLRGKKVVGLHIRRGDACPILPMMAAATSLAAADSKFMTDSGRFCPKSLSKTYGYWLFQLHQKYGVDAVYMATDSEEAAEWCASMTQTPCYSIQYNRSALAVNSDDGEIRDHFIERRLADGGAGTDTSAGLDTEALFVGALADMELLAASDYFVGVFAASMSRQAYQLMFARHQHHRPFVSLDMRWAQTDGSIN